MADPHSIGGLTIPLWERFWTHVNRTETCWLWTGARQHKYGKVRVYSGPRSYREERAHRVAWILTYGPIHGYLCVLHRCDVPLCVRPDHLFLGTRTENLADMTAKGRRVHGERAGRSKLTAAIVADIKARVFKRGDMTLLARQLGVSHATLSLIRSGKNWKGVPVPPEEPAS